MNLQFANAWVLYLLWLVPALAAWWYALHKRHEKNLEAFVSVAMQKKLRPATSTARFKWQAGLVTAAVFLAMVAAARPQWGTREETVYQRSRDVVIALDVSRSMLANDVHPNRLRRAVADILDLIKVLDGDRAALLAFRRTGILLCPLTTDYAYLRQALDSVSTDSAPAGETNIGDAILKALAALENSEGSHKAIILISDGEDMTGQALQAAEKAAEQKVPIFTVGLGSQAGARIPEEVGSRSYSKYKGVDITTKLESSTLKAIADKTGGADIPIATRSMTSVTLGTLYRNHLRNITAREVEETLQRRYVERYQYFLLPALLLLIAAAFLSRGRISTGGTQQAQSVARRTSPGPAAKRTAAALLLIFAAALQAGEGTNSQASTAPAAGTNAPAARPEVPAGRAGARIAQGLYLAGEYEKSAAAYIEAARFQGDKSYRDFRFNAAVSLYKSGQYKQAADILRDIVLSEKKESEESSTALGASLYEAASRIAETNMVEKAEFLRQAGEAFKDAARSGEHKDGSLKNLAVVLKQLPAVEQEALIAKMMAQYGPKSAADIANEMLAGQREVMTGIPAAFSNDSPARIGLLEALGKKQKENANLWIPLKGKLLQELSQQPGQTNMQQYTAFVNQLAEDTRDKMRRAASNLRDLNLDGFGDASACETVVYQLWKGVAPYSMVLQEDIRRQTNTIDATVATKPDNKRPQAVIAEQQEAADLTNLFEQRFLEAFPEGGGKQAARQVGPEGGTNQPPALSAEDRKKIIELTQQAKALQKSSLDLVKGNLYPEALETERKAYDVLKEIEKLLPKDKQQQQQNKDEQKNDQQNKEQPQDNKKDDKDKDQQKKEKKELSDEQLKALLDKALQREKEHEEEKRQRNRIIPPSGIDRDW
ncbi:MAG: hypothetical protein C0404_10160 [Verrucomicrobia bacterium]|nr:hypothetical protein [Verrucomicrobiota bacterium]